jgi:hypothetical protein
MASRIARIPGASLREIHEERHPLLIPENPEGAPLAGPILGQTEVSREEPRSFAVRGGHFSFSADHHSFARVPNRF